MDDVRENEMLHIENSELRYTNRALLAQLDEASADVQRFEAALVEIRGICTAMMDGWGQTVTVLDKIRKITLAAIKRQPGEPAHRPETFA